MDDVLNRYMDHICMLEAENKLLTKKLGKSYHDFVYYYSNYRLDEIADHNETIRAMILKIKDLPFSAHTKNVLSRTLIETLGELAQYELTDFARLTGFGPRCAYEIENILKEHHLSMGMDVEGIVKKVLKEEHAKKSPHRV